MKKELPAFPCGAGTPPSMLGLSKREYIMVLMAQSLIVNRTDLDPTLVAREAAKHADALMEVMDERVF